MNNFLLNSLYLWGVSFTAAVPWVKLNVRVGQFPRHRRLLGTGRLLVGRRWWWRPVVRFRTRRRRAAVTGVVRVDLEGKARTDVLGVQEKSATDPSTYKAF